MVINPIFIWGLFILICIVTTQLAHAKDYPMALAWFGAAITEAGWLWYVYQSG